MPGAVRRASVIVAGWLAMMVAVPGAVRSQSWTADNGNGTFTNPLFYDEFSDPDMIRVGDDFYLAGTTMHCTPGLVILHSRDLVNWDFKSYCFDRFDMGDEFRLENGREAYGQGIWAPCIRYHEGKFYVFSNINGHGMQVFIADKPEGPWKHINMGGNIYDLSVLFDDDGKIYAVYKYDEVRLIEIKPDFSGYVEGSERVIIPAGNAMGEGHHFYKINGRYYIISADYAPVGRMQCARADRPEGPYETVTISARETMGTMRAMTVGNVGLGSPVPADGFSFRIDEPQGNYFSAVPLHQGGIVDLPNGEWWGFSMTDFMAVGRTTCLSPVTWVDGWPYFGLPGNPGRSPRTWFKPDVGEDVKPHAPYERSDSFDGSHLKPVWQWNHEPVKGKWRLSGGKLRLRTLPAKDFLWARNTLTQRGVGPVSVATVKVDASRLKAGDVAGIGLLNMPYAWIGLLKNGNNYVLRFNDQATAMKIDTAAISQLYLRVSGDFHRALAQFSWSADGQNFMPIGHQVKMPYQLKTFQGTRYALFAYNTEGHKGGEAAFDDFTLDEPLADRSGNLPLGQTIRLVNLGSEQFVWANPHGMLHSAARHSAEAQGNGCRFRVHDRGKGRVALEAMDGSGFVTVVGQGLSADVRLLKQETEGSLFLWQDMLQGECMLLSLKTNRYVGINPATGEPYGADWPGTRPDRRDGTVFRWEIAGE